MTRAPWTLAVMGAALFLILLNILIVGAALHSIDLDLGGASEKLEWRSTPSRVPSSCC